MSKIASLRHRLKKATEQVSHSIFEQYDYNQDGLVGRDEWEGSDEVFTLLDQDRDEYISPSEATYGLGSSFSKMAEEDRYLTPEEIAKIMGGTLISKTSSASRRRR